MNKVTAILFCTFSILTFKGFAQTTENVNFNNYSSASDNDFVNWFSGGNGLNQITTNGITGGSLSVPDSVNWGNDEMNYCSKYVGDLLVPTNTSVCFKYDTALINLPGFDRGVSIWLKPSSDFNHYIIASYSHQKRIEILSYSWTNNPGPLLSLVQGNWYQLVLATTFLSGDSVGIHAEVNDLGVTGVGTPTLLAQSNGAIADSIFANDNAIQIGVSGTRKGGAIYLDDFHFSGHKSADSCVIVVNSVNGLNSADDFIFSNENSRFQLFNNHSSLMNIEIVNLSGEIISTVTVANVFSWDASQIPSGIYFLKAKSVDGNLVKKFAVIK